MKLADFGVLLCGVLLNAFAQLWLKAATQVTGPMVTTDGNLVGQALKLLAVPPFWYALTAYGVSVIVWTVGLSRVPVSQAYPLLSLGYVLNIGLAWWFFAEVPNATRVVGVAVIIVGVVLVARS
jgi:multidrug transporter EmrE-like cation transporter